MVFLPREVGFQKIEQAGDEGVLMTRLAIAVNNFMSGRTLLNYSKQIRDNPATEHEGLSLGFYVLNTQIGYLYEAMYLLERPNDPTPTFATQASLKAYITKLTADGKKCYEAITSMLKGGTELAEFDKYIKRFRNTVAFHYDTGHRGRTSKGNVREDPIAKSAIVRLAALDVPGPLYVGKYPFGHFGFGDTVMDTATCRQAWGIDPKFTGDEFRKRVDEIIEWIQQKIIAFAYFGSELCLLYFREKAPPGSLWLPIDTGDFDGHKLKST